MANRIPLKGHRNRSRYWRDKDILETLRQAHKRATDAVNDPASELHKQGFSRALDRLEEAISEFELTWYQPYNT